MDNEFESKAIITKISATSRASIKIDDRYFTVEYSEERAIPNLEDTDIDKERKVLWDTVNNECDSQVEEIYNTFKFKG